MYVALNEIAPLTGGMSGAICFTLMTGAAAPECISGKKTDAEKVAVPEGLDKPSFLATDANKSHRPSLGSGDMSS
jgi:hypothetical protein